MAEENRLVYMTAPSRDEAMSIARVVVEERLAACVNVLGDITSVYWWDGKINQEGEVALVAKTRTGQVEALIARVRAIHPYDCPCIVAMPIIEGNPAFLEWIGRETTV